MRLAGRICEWNDDRGFGFVMPNGGGDRAFVHIKGFQQGSRRPVVGDLISYLPRTDSKGRLQAQDIRHAGQKIELPRMHARTEPSRVPRATIGVLALALSAGGAALGILPAFLAGGYLVMSCVSYLMYFFDKAAAAKNNQRTPEKVLHLADLLGGWPGALLAQQQYHHKTIKQPFQAIFWITVAANIVGIWWLVFSGVASGGNSV